MADNPLGQIVQLKNILEKCLLWARNVYCIFILFFGCLNILKKPGTCNPLTTGTI